MVLSQVSISIYIRRKNKADSAEGSTAAAIQSMISPVQTRSIFSLLQSAGAGGSGLTVVDAIVSTGAGVGLSAVAAKSAVE